MIKALIVSLLLTCVTLNGQEVSKDTSLWLGIGVTTNPYYPALANDHINYLPGIRGEVRFFTGVPLLLHIQYNHGILRSRDVQSSLDYGFLSVGLLYRIGVFNRAKSNFDIGFGAAFISLLEGRGITSNVSNSLPNSGPSNSKWNFPLFDREILSLRAGMNYDYKVQPRQVVGAFINLDVLTSDFLASGDPRVVPLMGITYKYQLF